MARQAKCGACGYTNRLADGAASMPCRNCGAIVTDDDDKNVAFALASHYATYPNPTPLRPGMKGRFLGRDYTITGRVVLGMREEGEMYYWHEFELQAPDGDLLYLEFDEGTWKWTRPFVPRSPIGPQEAVNLRPGARLALDEHGVLVTQNSTAVVEFSEGNLTYQKNPGERTDYLDAGYGNRVYSVEWGLDEIEFFRGETMAERDVLLAFGLHEQVAALDAVAVRCRSQNTFATVCLFMGLLALMLWGSSGSSGHQVRRESIPIAAITQEGVRFGPFTLDPAQRVHRLTIFGNMNEASAWVAGVLEAADGSELISAERDFWDETGYDDDGRWHESDLRADTDFMALQPGPYYVRLYTEIDTPGGNLIDAGYEVRAGVTYGRYYGWFGFLALATAILFYCVANWTGLKKMAEAASENSDDDD